MAMMGKLLGIPSSPRTYSDSTKLVLSKCLTGIEFEAENVPKGGLPVTEEWTAVWKQERDGSLREGGLEFVLREPLFGSDLTEAITHFCTWAKEKKLESNFRTGLHVHIDCRNMELEQLVTMLIVYALYEKLLFRWAGDDREGCIFCLPFYKAEAIIPVIGTALADKKNARLLLPSQEERYSALNLNALVRYGSIEWRHLQTTFDEDRIIKWVNCAQSFKKFGRQNKLNPWELLTWISQNGAFQSLADIVGPVFAQELWHQNAEKEMWAYGGPIAHDLCLMLTETVKGKWGAIKAQVVQGTNTYFQKWAEKKAKMEGFKRPDNIFSDPNLFNDANLREEATRQVYANVRQLLENGRF